MLVKSVPSSPFGYSDGLTRGGKSSVDIRCKYTMSDSIQIQQFILLFFCYISFIFWKHSLLICFYYHVMNIGPEKENYQGYSTIPNCKTAPNQISCWKHPRKYSVILTWLGFSSLVTEPVPGVPPTHSEQHCFLVLLLAAKACALGLPCL